MDRFSRSKTQRWRGASQSLLRCRCHHSPPDRNSRRRDFQFDTLNRLTTETWYVDASPAQTLTATYDPVGNQLGKKRLP